MNHQSCMCMVKAATTCLNHKMRFLFLCMLFCMILIPQSHSSAATQPSAYWLVAEETLKEVPPKSPLVLYQGNINVDVPKQITKYDGKGLKPKPFKDQHVTLMFKLFGALPDPAFMLRTYAHRAARWSKYKAEVDGIQIDYDATAQDFDAYTTFLTELRTTLVDVPISITGPLEWLTEVPANDLKILSGTVSYVSFDLYRGDRPLPSLQDYPALFRTISFPFKVGLMTGSETPELLRAFSQNPHFQGAILYPGATKDDK